MKKIIGLLSILVLTLLVGCSNTEEQDALTKILDQGYMIVGLDDTFAPMGFRDEAGEIVGFDVDLAREVADRLGVELRLQPIDWDAKVLELDAGNIDMIWNGLTVTEERKAQINFSRSYFNDRQMFMVRNDGSITSKDDLAGLKVGVQLDSTGQYALEGDVAFLDSLEEMVKFSSFSEAYLALESGVIDAVIVDEIAGLYAASKSEGAFTSLDETYGEEQMAIGFRLGDDALRDRIDEILDEMDDDGSATEISVKWFTKDVFVR